MVIIRPQCKYVFTSAKCVCVCVCVCVGGGGGGGGGYGKVALCTCLPTFIKSSDTVEQRFRSFPSTTFALPQAMASFSSACTHWTEKCLD